MEDLWAGFHRLDESIKDSLEQLNAPGIALGITDKKGMIHLGLYGFANRENQTPVQADTLFEIGSISKSFAAIVVLQLWEAGLIDLHAPIMEYLPWFEVHSKYESFGLHHLLSHTAGIATGGDFYISAIGNIWGMRNQETSAPPGVHFHYSNDGYKIIGLVLERILKQSIVDILSERVLLPCGMGTSKASIQNSFRNRMASGYEAFYDERPLPPGGQLAPATWMEYNSADGSIISTAEDMCQYIRALLNGGNGLLGAPGFRRLISPVIAVEDNSHGEWYAYGLNVNHSEGSTILSHSGGMVGYTAQMIADLGAGIGVIVLTNGPSRPDVVAKYALRFTQAMLSRAHRPTKSLAEELEAIEDASDFEGVYRGEKGSIEVHSRHERLWAQLDDGKFSMTRLDGDHFSLAHPDFDLFPFTFERLDGMVVSAGCGGEWYARENAPKHPDFTVPDIWEAYLGHYRAHNPWYSNFRIVNRRDKLLMIDQLSYESPLIPISEHTFRIGDEPHSPESIKFTLFIDGLAMRAQTAGGDYCRTFTH